jgi:EamA-like transporter family.
METGLILAFGVAIIKGVQSIYQRKNALETDEFVTAWSSRVFGVPVLLAALVYTGLPDVTLGFFLLVVPQSLVIALTSILIAKAYKKSDASIVTPMFAISPILVLGTSFLMLGETPSILGVIGVILVASGAYVLKSGAEGDMLEPLRRLWEERGVQIILVVILIYSVTANLDKIGVNMSSPILWPLTVYTLSSLFMLPIMAINSGDWRNKIMADWKPLVFLGASGGAAVILQMTAIKLTLVSYVVSIKRLSIPLTVLLSYLYLGETDEFWYRIAGSVLMAAGALLIYL